MPPHHPIFGHVLLIKNILSKLPSDAHPIYLPGLLRRAFPEVGHVFYLGLWPVGPSLLIVSSASVGQQFTVQHPLRKSPELRNWLKSLTENQDLVSSDGQAWQAWHKVFSPGFSASHLI